MGMYTDPMQYGLWSKNLLKPKFFKIQTWNLENRHDTPGRNWTNFNAQDYSVKDKIKLDNLFRSNFYSSFIVRLHWQIYELWALDYDILDFEYASSNSSNDVILDYVSQTYNSNWTKSLTGKEFKILIF